MKKIHNKIFAIEDNIYGVDLEVIIGDYNYYSNYVSKKYDLQKEEQVNFGGENHFLVGFVEEGKKKEHFAANVIWLPKSNWNISDYVVLSHEIIHAAMRTLQRVGITIDPNNHEALTYYHDYLYGEALNKMLKYAHKK